MYCITGIRVGDGDTLALLAQLVGIVQCSASHHLHGDLPGVALGHWVSRPCSGGVTVVATTWLWRRSRVGAQSWSRLAPRRGPQWPRPMWLGACLWLFFMSFGATLGAASCALQPCRSCIGVEGGRRAKLLSSNARREHPAVRWPPLWCLSAAQERGDAAHYVVKSSHHYCSGIHQLTSSLYFG